MISHVGKAASQPLLQLLTPHLPASHFEHFEQNGLGSRRPAGCMLSNLRDSRYEVMQQAFQKAPVDDSTSGPRGAPAAQ
jgi:hypothetical protein